MPSKATFAGDMSGSFSLSNLNNQFSSLFQGDSSPLRPRAQSTPNMTVAISASLVESFYSPIWLLSTAPLNYAGGNSGAISAPSANPRIDLLYITSGGTLTWVTGTENASPTAPNLDADGFPICYVYCKTTMTKIVNYEDKDANPNEGYIWKDVRAMGLFIRILTTAMGGTGQDFSATVQGSVLYFSGTGVMAALGVGTDGQCLATQGAAANPHWITVLKSGDAAGGDLTGTFPNPTIGASKVTYAHQLTSAFKNIQAFTGSGTWTQPAGVTTVYVKVWGGGAGGAYISAAGNGANGGSGGGYSEGLIAVSGNVTVTIGDAGTGGTGGSPGGTAGGTSSFAGDSTIQATGGAAGAGAAGVGSGGTINLTGGVGAAGAASFPGGNGGSAPAGGIGGSMKTTSGSGNVGQAPGGGGGGAYASGNGGAGSAGMVIVYY